jgi:acyl-CoA reductase-like NAD-dependent aldehyde dehydrogenase
MNAIIESAVAAQKKWREVPVQQRVRILIKFHTLLVANKDSIADIIVRYACLFTGSSNPGYS